MGNIVDYYTNGKWHVIWRDKSYKRYMEKRTTKRKYPQNFD